MKKSNIIWALRFLVAALFVFSAFAKMFPLWAFEKQLVDLGLMSWCNAHYFARLLIALELALGVAIIQPHFLKRIVLPSTILLLVLFCIHLIIEMVKHGAMNGNCGCFGQLIPMTPLEAFVKNILTLGILGYIYVNVSDKPKGENRFSILLVIGLLCSLLMFILFPFCPCEKELANAEQETAVVMEEEPVDDEVMTTDTAAITSVNPSAEIKDTALKTIQDTVKKEIGPAPVKSKFTNYNVFDGKKVNIDNGKKILCLFVPGCDHCQHAAQDLAEMSKKPGFPPVYIYFMDEEPEKIPDFHKIVGKRFPSKVVDIPTFWKLLGNGSTPGIVYLWNGNIITEFEGTGDNAFTKDKLKGHLQHAHGK
ncbi:MAG: MauE/DoxX family redox-associated membrane protein [Bacteroidota bacterium]